MNSLEKFKSYPEFDEYTKLVNQVDTNASPNIVISHRSTNEIQNSGKKLGIFSGSFNPLTLAHTKMVKQAQKQFKLDEMLLLIAKVNVDKEVFGWSLAGRLLTLKHYAAEHTNFSVGICSHGRYIEKVNALQKVYPSEPELYFIVGYDTLVRIFDPKYYHDIDIELLTLFSHCNFIVANRSEINIEEIKKFLDQPAIRPFQNSINILSLPDYYAQLSSTEVRELISKGDSVSHLVPTVIAQFLK